MIAVLLLVATAVFAYRLADSTGVPEASDATGLSVCSIIGLFFAGVLLVPAVLGGLLLGYARSGKAKHALPPLIVGGLLWAGLAALVVFG